MDKFDRRSLIGAVGLGVALAACGKTADSSEANPKKATASDAILGINEQWGEDPHKSAPSSPPANGFKPAYICIVYVRLDGNSKKSTIRHGYIALRPQQAEESVADYEKFQTGEAEKMFQKASSGPWNQNVPTGHRRKEVNFENFTFGRQMRIFMVVDEDNIKFDDRKANGKYANLVRFTQFRTSKRMDIFEPEPADQNHAFFGATIVPISLPGRTRQALRLDNWYIGPNGAAIDEQDVDTHQKYAMNLQLLWRAGDTGTNLQWIPFIIDPDGGNMGSQP